MSVLAQLGTQSHRLMNSTVNIFRGKCEKFTFALKDLWIKPNLLLPDDFIDTFALMGTPFPLISIIVVYLWLVMKFGPNFMKHRQPFKLIGAIRVYNLFQVAACIVFLICVNETNYSLRYAWRCYHVRISNRVSVIAWSCLILRLTEFIETFFFVLRKKSNQVSELHIYHHISTSAMVWLFLKYSAGELRK